jgi:hypothetical protein
VSEDGAHAVGELAGVPALVLQGDGRDVQGPLVLGGAQLLVFPFVLEPGDSGNGIATGRRAGHLEILARRQEEIFTQLSIQLRHFVEAVGIVLLQGHRLGVILERVLHLHCHVAPLARRRGARVSAGVGQTHFLDAQTKFKFKDENFDIFQDYLSLYKFQIKKNCNHFIKIQLNSECPIQI